MGLNLDYRELYRREEIGGILGMDFLNNFVLVVDFPKRSIRLLGDGSKIRLSRKLATVEMKSAASLLLLPIGLPSGKTVDLLFDTGADSAADAILFKPLVSELLLQPPYHSSSLEDTLSSVPVQYGQLLFLTIGSLRVSPARVGLTDAASILASSLHHAGKMGLFAFDQGLLVVDLGRIDCPLVGHCPESSVPHKLVFVSSNGEDA